MELFANFVTVSSEEKRVIVVETVTVVISMCLVQCVAGDKEETHSFYFVSLNQLTPSIQLLACFAKAALKKQAAGTGNPEVVLAFVSPAVEARTGEKNQKADQTGQKESRDAQGLDPVLSCLTLSFVAVVDAANEG